MSSGNNLEPKGSLHPRGRDYRGREWVRVSGPVAKMLAGELDLTQWDDEELFRGRQRDKNGNFSGRPPSLVPRAAYEEFVRRQLERAEQLFVSNIAEAVEELVKIAKDPDVDESVRLKAIQMISDRTLGAVKQRVDIGAAGDSEPWKAIVEAVTVNRDLPDEDDVIDAEVVDEEPDWETELDEWED